MLFRSAPQVSSTWVIGVEEDGGLVYSNDSGRGGVTHWQLTGSDTVLEGPIWLFFGLADNVNSDGATVEVTLKNNDGEESLSMDDMYWESNFDAIVKLFDTNPNNDQHCRCEKGWSIKT